MLEGNRRVIMDTTDLCELCAHPSLSPIVTGSQNSLICFCSDLCVMEAKITLDEKIYQDEEWQTQLENNLFCAATMGIIAKGSSEIIEQDKMFAKKVCGTNFMKVKVNN
ncbi:hypothetical protein GOODEAATRI_006731 [Goodea atripinnis]|uniref:Uncharacterized protein n=1 Tax=Goodea atripinnis TaxID=208336 RepID=A0ABV0PBY5_9TELE